MYTLLAGAVVAVWLPIFAPADEKPKLPSVRFPFTEEQAKLFQDEYKVPLLDPVFAAQLTAFVELTVPMFLFLGLATRLATLPLLGMVFVIQTFVYPQAWTEHLLWASVLVFLLTRGPGALSVDHLIERHFARE